MIIQENVLETRAQKSRVFLKKFFYLFLFLFLGAVFGISYRGKVFNQEKTCPFCSPSVLEKQTLFYKEKVLSLIPHKSATKGHLLVLPKRHVENFSELSSQEFLEIQETLKELHAKVQTQFPEVTGFFLLQKNGKDAGQSVPHLHFHYSRLNLKLHFLTASKPLKSPIVS